MMRTIQTHLFQYMPLSRTTILLALLTFATLMAACGGGGNDKGDRVLRLDGYDATYRTLQLQTRAALASGGVAACRQFSDMSPKEVLAYIDQVGTGAPPTPPQGSTLKPGQKADPASREALAEILLDECKRLS